MIFRKTVGPGTNFCSVTSFSLGSVLVDSQFSSLKCVEPIFSMHLRKTEEVDLSMYGDSKAITFNKGNVTKQPCHARDQQRVHYFYHKQDKKFRWRTNDKKTNILVKAIAKGTIVSRHYKPRRTFTNSEVKGGE